MGNGWYYVLNSNKAQRKANTTGVVCKENIPRPGRQRNVAGKLLLVRTREDNRVQQSCMGWPNEYNIMQHLGKQKKCCVVQHLFGEKFDCNQTSYNKIQQGGETSATFLTTSKLYNVV